MPNLLSLTDIELDALILRLAVMNSTPESQTEYSSAIAEKMRRQTKPSPLFPELTGTDLDVSIFRWKNGHWSAYIVHVLGDSRAEWKGLGKTCEEAYNAALALVPPQYLSLSVQLDDHVPHQEA